MECKDLEGQTVSGVPRRQRPFLVNDNCCASPGSKERLDEDLSLINAAVADSPLTLSETYLDTIPDGPYKSTTRKSTATHSRQRRTLASLSFSSPSKRFHARSHRWRMFSGSSPRKHLMQGLRIVKSKTRGVASNTQRGLASIKSLPESSGLARVSARKSVSDIVRRTQVRARASHVSKTAQKSFDYIKERALTASLAISDRVSETAKKGIQMAKDLARIGGA